MKMKTVGLALLTAAATALAAYAAGDDAVKTDLALMQGEWSMISGSADGQAMPQEMVRQMKRICKGQETTTLMAGRVYFKAKITIAPAEAVKTIDYDMTEGPTAGKKQLGIYALDGDLFKACFAKPGAERPTNFTTTAGDGRTLSIWKRDKPSADSPAQK